MSEVERRHGGAAQLAPSTALVLQCVVSVAGTMVGESLGDTLVEKLLGGLLLCVVGAFLMAPGRHHRRRVVAVTLLLALLGALRRAGDALASTDRERHPPPPGTSVPANWLAVGLVSVAAFGLGSLGTTVTDGWASGSGADLVSVPAVVGRSAADARTLLRRAGFHALRAPTPSTSVPKGRAIGSSPVGGAKAVRGSNVRLFVSSGAPGRRLRIPAVRGLPEQAAQTLLEQAHLRAQRAGAPSVSVPKGLAIGTSPRRGATVRAGSSVKLFISSGPPGSRVKVPSVRGLPERDARALLEQAGLAARRVAASSASVSKGSAIRTSPPAGMRVRAGSSIALYVCTGSPGQRVRIPAVRGLLERQARTLLEDLGLHVVRREVPSEQIARGEATATLPAADTTVTAGSRIVLLISTGAPGDQQVLVPDIRDLPERSALTRLRSAGLDATSQPTPSDDIAAGSAIATDPPAGERVDRGTRVQLLVSTGSRVDRVQVPQLIGDLIEQARDRLDALKLRAETLTRASSAPAGTVLGSDPKSGSFVDVGSTVRLELSSGTLVRVPDVVGDGRDDAQRTLIDSDLTPDFTQVASTAPYDTVIRTNPAANEEVGRGSVVTVSVSCGAVPCIR